MNTYKITIEASEDMMAKAMDIPGYSHMAMSDGGSRVVYFESHNKREATLDAATALGVHPNRLDPVRA